MVVDRVRIVDSVLGAGLAMNAPVCTLRDIYLRSLMHSKHDGLVHHPAAIHNLRIPLLLSQVPSPVPTHTITCSCALACIDHQFMERWGASHKHLAASQTPCRACHVSQPGGALNAHQFASLRGGTACARLPFARAALFAVTHRDCLLSPASAHRMSTQSQ